MKKEINHSNQRIKSRFKSFLRNIAYSRISQELIAVLIAFYMRLVFVTSKKEFVGFEDVILTIRDRHSFIGGFWHNRLMMIPLFSMAVLKASGTADYHFISLSSKHGDGRIVARIMEKFNFVPILGSSRSSNNKERGIELSSMRQIIKSLSENPNALGTPFDGPRGPNQQINGKIVEIAQLSGALIFPISYSAKNFIELNSWDKFKIPLPFSSLCFYCDKAIKIEKDLAKDELEKVKKFIKERMDFVQEESLRLARSN